MHHVRRVKQRMPMMLFISRQYQQAGFILRRPMGLTSAKANFLTLLSTALMVCTSMPCVAISYGVYDSRGLAMGGSATAVGKYAQAAFYNPALLGFDDLDEERGRDGRVY